MSLWFMALSDTLLMPLLFLISLCFPCLPLPHDEFSFCLRRAEMMSSSKAGAWSWDGGLFSSWTSLYVSWWKALPSHLSRLKQRRSWLTEYTCLFKIFEPLCVFVSCSWSCYSSCLSNKPLGILSSRYLFVTERPDTLWSLISLVMIDKM